MTSGGNRNRKQQPHEGSATSERRGYSLTELPAEPFDGIVPEFPLPEVTDRESDVWSRAWTWPQAYLWSMPGQEWRIPVVAMWVRLTVRCEIHDSPAALLAQLHRFADQIALTQAGLAEAGYKILLPVETGEAPKSDDDSTQPKSRRLRVVG